MRYYIEDENQPNGFLEVTKDEYSALFGDDIIRTYVQAVYCGDIAIDDVPPEHKDTVQNVVTNKTNRWGVYKNCEEVEA